MSKQLKEITPGNFLISCMLNKLRAYLLVWYLK
jgi:hypothetical protein